MRRIREILRLKLDVGLSNREAARSAGSSPASVCDMMQRARRAELMSWAEVDALDETALEAMLYARPASTTPRSERPRPDPVWIHTERQSRKGVTLELLHVEWLEANPDGLQYTRFCDIYRGWLRRRKLSMRQVHRAGEKTFVDYSGQTAEVVDPKTGEVRVAQIFVATLGASNYTFAEATWSQKLPDWTASHVRACEFFGGVTEVWVPDQLRSAVSGPHRYDPEINPTYHELGEHYGAVIIPARPRKPQDKAKVEVAVQIIQRWILARLRKQTFFSLAALNARIAEIPIDEGISTAGRGRALGTRPSAGTPSPSTRGSARLEVAKCLHLSSPARSASSTVEARTGAPPWHPGKPATGAHAAEWRDWGAARGALLWDYAHGPLGKLWSVTSPDEHQWALHVARRRPARDA